MDSENWLPSFSIWLFMRSIFAFTALRRELSWYLFLLFVRAGVWSLVVPRAVEKIWRPMAACGMVILAADQSSLGYPSFFLQVTLLEGVVLGGYPFHGAGTILFSLLLGAIGRRDSRSRCEISGGVATVDVGQAAGLSLIIS